MRASGKTHRVDGPADGTYHLAMQRVARSVSYYGYYYYRPAITGRTRHVRT